MCARALQHTVYYLSWEIGMTFFLTEKVYKMRFPSVCDKSRLETTIRTKVWVASRWYAVVVVNKGLLLMTIWRKFREEPLYTISLNLNCYMNTIRQTYKRTYLWQRVIIFHGVCRPNVVFSFTTSPEELNLSSRRTTMDLFHIVLSNITQNVRFRKTNVNDTLIIT